MQHGGEMCVVEVEGVGRGTENHRTRIDIAGAENLRDRRHRGMAEAAGDAAEDIEERAFRLAPNGRREVFPARARHEARELGG